jgi:hypothetical protein
MYRATAERYVGMITGSFENYAGAVEVLVYTGTDVYSSFKRITMAPAGMATAIAGSIKDMREAIKSLDITALPVEWGDVYGNVGGAFDDAFGGEGDESNPKPALNNIYTRNTEEVIQSLENAADALCAASASLANPWVITFPGANGAMEYILAMGYTQITATSETTLEQLAALYLGNPDMAQAIALMNGIAGDEAIAPGLALTIPVVSNGGAPALVFDKSDRRDQIGVDIAIRNGKFCFNHNGDFAAVSGQENIGQAIGMRLAESLGGRLRLSVYGIRNAVDMPDTVAIAYVAASVMDTILQDPRIVRIENLYFRGRADALYIEFDYYTIDGALQKYRGTL